MVEWKKSSKSNGSGGSNCVEVASTDQENAKPWQTSSFCGTSTCVEVKEGDDLILMRDSKNPEQGVLTFTREEWDAFVKGVEAGEFRDL